MRRHQNCTDRRMMYCISCGRTMWIFLIVSCSWLTHTVSALQQIVCNTEVFKAECPTDHVIMMQTALYGRMEVSRCVDRNYGYVGCNADVLSHMHALCSGRRSCEVRVPLKKLERTTPCPNDLKSYLLAEYECAPVFPSFTETCPPHARYEINATRPGMISNVVTMETGIGGPTCPYVLRVGINQLLRLTLRDFQLAVNQASVGPNTKQCVNAYAITREETAQPPSHQICAGAAEEEVVYTSVGNRVEIRILGGHSEPRNRFFFLKYEVMGCSVPDVGSTMRFTRRDDKPELGTVTCLANGQTWTARCRDNKWEDIHVGKCNDKAIVVGESGMSVEHPGDSGITHRMSMIIIIGIAVSIGLLILLVGVLIIWWRRRATDPYSHPGPAYAPDSEKMRDRYLGPLPPNPNYPMDQNQSEQSYFLRENDYAYISDMSSTYDPASIGRGHGPGPGNTIYQCQHHQPKDFANCPYGMAPNMHRCAKIKANVKPAKSEHKGEDDNRRGPSQVTSPILPLIGNNNDIPQVAQAAQFMGARMPGTTQTDTVRKGKHNERIYGPVQYTTYDHLMNAEGRSNHKSV